MNELTPQEISEIKSLLVNLKSLKTSLKDFLVTHNHNKGNSAQLNEKDFLNHTAFGGPSIYKNIITVVDDGYAYLPNSISGIGFVSSEGVEGAVFLFTSAGVPTILSGSTNAVTTDTDTKLCILDNGTNIAIRNRLGSSKTLKITILY